MVICIIALPVLALLGLFSLKYRMLAKEAFHCLFRTMALKPCDTGLDLKIKSKFTAKLMWWPAFARFFYKYFTLLSWIFVILMLLSAAGTGYGVYNYVKYGNCNGPNSPAFCVFNVVHPSQAECSTFGTEGKLYPENVKNEGYPARGNPNATLILAEYGCFSCPYTKEAEPVVREILGAYPSIKLVYHDVPLAIHAYSIEAGEAAICAGEQGRYWDYHDILLDTHQNLTNSSFAEIAQALGLNESKFARCFNSNATQAAVDSAYAEALRVGIYGTPTFFINSESLVGPQSFDKFKAIIEKELKR